MDESPRVDSLAKAVRTLALAVGFLAAGVLALFALYVFFLYQSRAFFRGATSASMSSNRTTHPAGPPGARADEKPFHSLPVEEKIQRSKAILLTKHQEQGGRVKAVVSEILKRPDAGLNYSVGDEFPDLSRYAEAGTDFGDGDVVFFADSSNDERESMTYRHGRIAALGDMPLDVLRVMIRGDARAKPTSSSRLEAPVTPPSSWGKQGGEISLERTTNGEGITRSFSISTGTALGIPEWFPEKGEPPLTMSKAIQSATIAASTQSPEHAAYVARSISLRLVSCDEPAGNRWYYVLDCVPRQSGGLGMSQSIPVVVLMDGTVVTGSIER
jgi:hypothetical protein